MTENQRRRPCGNLEFRNAGQMPLAEVAAAATRGFAGYFVPIHVDASVLLNMVRVDSVDLAASSVALSDGLPVGVAVVARRGWSSRLAMMSVEPAHRGQRIGSQLTQHVLAAARERSDREFVLECIEQNALALRLYQSAGFKSVRRLVGYTAERIKGQRDAALEEIDPASASAAVASWGVENLPWQMSPPTLAALTPPHRAYRLGPAWAVITSPAESTIAIRTLVVESKSRRKGLATRMVHALAAAFPEKNWRVAAMTPEEIPEAFFTRLGFQRTSITQFQMAQSLCSNERHK